MPSRVFFCTMRSESKKSSLPAKLRLLCTRGGLGSIVRDRDLVAIKLHFGEPGSTTFVPPYLANVIVEEVREAGGRPFLTDANTLYVGERSNAVDHLWTAFRHGFVPPVVAAPVIIADGLTGKDFEKVEIPGKHFGKVNIASAVVHADALVSITHFKGHMLCGFGGAIKNIGMGLASRSGKQQQHSELKPVVNREVCKGCMKCAAWCPVDAIHSVDGTALIDSEVCIGCGECTVTCPHGTIAVNWRTDSRTFQEKMAEYAYGVLQGKTDRSFHISFVTGVTPDCDCMGYSDAPLVPDIGILASRDPVALDQACHDLVRAAPGLPGSAADGVEAGVDKFTHVHKGNWMVQLEYAEKIGLGTRSYELVELG